MDALESDDIARKYQKQYKLGEGTYAVVYKAIAIASQHIVAIKKIKMGQFKDGIDMSAVREIKFLHELRHPNVITLHDIFVHKRNVNLVLEYLESDLEHVIRDKSVAFSSSHIKAWMLMTLRGVEHCHRSFVLHRDLKPNNLLIAGDGELKLADFGMARVFGEPVGNMTSQVVTRWYRCPELLFGAKDYGTAVDMWSVGCIFAELMLRVPYMAGESDMDQLKIIFKALGTPTEIEWPGMKLLPDYVEFAPQPKPNFRQLFTAASDDALDLLKALLTFDPLRRCTATEALMHAYFKNAPAPAHKSTLPRVTPSTSVLDTAGHVLPPHADELASKGVKRQLFA